MKLDGEYVLKKIISLCEERKCEFLYFCDINHCKSDWVNTTKTFLCFKCLKCGKIFFKRYYNFLKKNSMCPECGANKKIKEDDALNNIQKRCNEINCSFIEFCDKNGNAVSWKNNVTRLKILCNVCDKIFITNYASFINGKTKCPFCSISKRRLQLQYVLDKINEICEQKNYTFLGFYENENETSSYKNSFTKLKIKCNICNNVWITNYNNFVNNNNGCKICGIRKSAMAKQKTHDELMQKITDACNQKSCVFLGIKEKWVGCRNSKLIIKCNKCGIIWNPNYFHFTHSDENCPNCAKQLNKSETKIFEIIKKYFNNKTIERNVKLPFLNGKEIDIYIKEFNIGIEYQGIQHFKPVAIFGGIENYNEIKKRDELKFEECKKNGLKLFYFTYSTFYPKEYMDIIYTDENKLINEIKTYANNR